MTAWPTYAPGPPDFVSRHMHELGQCCSTLHSRLGQAVTEALRESAAGLGREAVDRLLALACPVEGTPATNVGYGEDDDPWHEEPHDITRYAWPPRAAEPDLTTAAPLACTSADLRTLTWAVAAAQWWLRLYGSLVGACSVGLATGIAVAVGQRWAPQCRPLLESTQQLLQAQRALQQFSRWLRQR